ncbi:hypothetical protein EW145_g6105 [Phellinidium pouzarii]|uniref:NOT2/NOT3/NOT5 C-terminal domain-containing protein n=1 Tax=Phellinidium pouzarii TaxID=167371 RepID=A0A4S4KXQ6_9AGAM|nr:hypothetical protein EW145_g6105 [Phellinidium pouzarii]
MVLPSPNFMQQRGQSAFPFGGILGQPQTQQQLSQSHQQSHASLVLGQQQQQQQQQQQSTSTTAPQHLLTPNLPSAQSNTSLNEGALDPNDFPALGSGPANANTSVATNSPVTTLASSYASQAGTGVVPGGTASGQGQGQGQGQSAPLTGTVSVNQPRDFTPDDFPALGGQAASGQQQQSSHGQQAVQDASHPPGLNGYEHRQNMPPGVLSLVSAQRNTLPDAEKRATSKLASWNGINASSSNQQNGSSQQHSQQLGAPGLPPSFQQQQQQQQQQAQAQQAYSTGDGALASATQANATAAAPQTPAQQILMSPADRWGLLGLLAAIKNADADQNLLSIGTDLGTMGLDMQNQGSLFSTFITPWSDSSAAHTVEPDYHLPQCYSVNAPPPGPNKAQAFSEETLFYMFYAHPRDALQEVAAQELFTRNWRYNKELRLWLTKETGRVRHSKTIENGLGEQGIFTYWDPDVWEKGLKEFTVLYADLENKDTPAFAGPTLQPTAQGQQLQTQGQLQAGTAPGPTIAQLAQAQAGRTNFPGLSMTAAAM